MLSNEGKVSLYSFLGCAGVFCALFVNIIIYNLFASNSTIFIALPIIYFVIVNIVLTLLVKGYAYQVAVRATFLGFVFAVGIYIIILASASVKVFGVYMCVMSIFHYSEFLAISIIQPKLVSVDSFVINHSVQYSVAAVTSWLEFGIESYFFPGLKTIFWLSNFGLVVCIIGEFLRKAAMFTAKSNFNHLVQCEKADDHVLVSHGVYNWFRHPSYVGWFYWSIGTQVILLNPLCTVAYTLASWFFFRERVMIEEITLLNFFGQEYCDYQQKVGTGLPFIDGYKV